MLVGYPTDKEMLEPVLAVLVFSIFLDIDFVVCL